MRKFILYFLLLFLFLAVGTFSYGFWNGKKIRGFAAQVSEVEAKHDLAPQIEKIETSFRDNGKKEISQIRDESRQFSVELEGVIKEAEAAKKEIENLNASKPAENAKKLTGEYYWKLAREASDLKGIIDYMSQIIEVAAVFGEMKENSSLDEMKNIIARAKEKGSAIQTENLPQSLQTNAQNLKDSMNTFLVKMEDVATLKSENTAALDESYNDFSQKEDEFFSAGKKYIDGMEDLDIIEGKIKSEIERLGRVRFSLK
ncbi:MAG: hypothetical protein QMD77_03775 [Patescibacteria group bacterium]|nr:hypothetical protein [Patescibacteria group bacterium]